METTLNRVCANLTWQDRRSMSAVKDIFLCSPLALTKPKPISETVSDCTAVKECFNWTFVLRVHIEDTARI